VILLSDEIYGELHYEGRHVSVARYYPEGTIVSGGLSKWCGAGGWRLGAFVFPPSLRWLLDAMAVAASESYTSTSSPIQYAAVRAYAGSLDIERHLWQSRRILKALAHWVTWKLREGGALVAVPQGAFYVFPDFSAYEEQLRSRGVGGSQSLCEQLLTEAGVGLLPGSVFGRPDEELTLRVAFVDFDGARALAGAEQLPEHGPVGKRFLKTYCGGVMRAVTRMCDWISEGS
jgi:aspartate aminotransferase